MGTASSSRPRWCPPNDPTLDVHQCGDGAVQRCLRRRRNPPLQARHDVSKNACASPANTTISKKSAAPPGTIRCSKCWATSRSATTFKEEAIVLAWKLIKDEMALDTNKIWITVFGGAEGIPADSAKPAPCGARSAGLPDSRIIDKGMKDNFWAMGDTGPVRTLHRNPRRSGPGHPHPCEDFDNGRVVEIWNNVFMQFERQARGRHGANFCRRPVSTREWASSASQPWCRGNRATTIATYSWPFWTASPKS